MSRRGAAIAQAREVRRTSKFKVMLARLKGGIKMDAEQCDEFRRLLREGKQPHPNNR